MEIVCSVQNFGQFREKKCETPLHAGSTDVLVRYWDFLSKIPARQKTLHRGILFGHVVLIVALVLIKILFQTHVLAMTPDTSLAIHAKRAIYAILAILSISLFLSQLYHVLALNPAFPVLPISRQRRIRAGISRTMYERIHISLCSRKATNPRDMSFGIHCVLKTDSKAKSLLPLDYRLPCEVVYMQLASFLLHESGTLDVLILAAQGRYLHAPSWVPDFSQILHPTAVAHETETMSATLYSAPIWSFMNYDPHALAVKGFLCEEIIATFGFIQTDDRFLITEAPLHIKNLDTMLRLTESSTLLNCLRTLSPEVLFQSGSDISASAKVFRFFRSYLRWLQRNHQRRAFKLLSMLQQSHLNSTVVYSNLKRSGISSGLNIGRLTYQDLLYVHIKVCNVFACQKLKFFRTMTSAGYCYNDPAIGDRLALVSGVSIPLIVRPCESSVNLVSLAVLDNEYMAGFVWREIFRNRRNNWLASRTDQGAAIDIKTFLSSDAWLDDIIIS
jgi:hypothetical protein